MEKTILWLALIIGIAFLIFSLRKLPLKEWLLVYLLTSYFSITLGVIVVEENMLDYPIKFLVNHFDTSLLFEYLILPVICIYFYLTTYNSSYTSMIVQGIIYIIPITIIEVFLERYTNLIEYYTWTWLHTFISTFLLIIFIRILMMFIYKLDK